ncbi:Zn-ribbon domain-containing OB-fold protein [Achromobacter pestifer]|uniref:Zn-ribbon domain-containing OB-fold protein n=1 Tax=Achromobacter pestifer TaxID=1353889 RepID=A0A7D4IKA0_9BURK|nr:Zn-ribbon domain-containing OB-fold protein [Achromobacter pestifer]QKH37483.1 Zn-ribbon domain-containing OB-fold protein [Achromobacter pestifer]
MTTTTDSLASHGNPLLPEFLAAGSEGRLLLRWCNACERSHWYPRHICPHCFNPATAWRESPGLGEIYAFSIMRRAATPYVIAYVQLDEGVTMMTNIQTHDLDGVRIGQRVRATFGGPALADGLPVFRRVE